MRPKKRKSSSYPLPAEVQVMEQRQMLSATVGVWITKEQIAALPTTGTAWNGLVSAANKSSSADLSNQDNNDDVNTLAKALVGVRTGNETMMADARKHIMSIMETENGGRSLALARNLPSYVIAADLVGLSSADETKFKSWLKSVVNERMDEGRTLKQTFEQRPNNWGTHAGAALASIAVYTNDSVLLARVVQVYKGWLGDRSSYTGFKYGDLDWQANKNAPVGINPLGAKLSIGGSLRDVDGALPEEMRRGGSLSWPPKETGYAYEALQGALVTAEILHNKGYDVYNWSDKALLRAYKFLDRIGWQAEGDDRWQMNIVNLRYNTSFPSTLSANYGKNMGWTSWTHQKTTATSSVA